MNTNLFFKTTLVICLVSFVAVLFPQLGFGHTDGSGNPLPHATVRVWDTRGPLGRDPDDSVEDLAGLTVDVATVAAPLTIATAWENTTCPGGPCGAMLWNPATDDFHCWGVTGGFTASIDLNVSAPVRTDAAGRTYQPGDIWVGGPNSAPVYVKFKSAAFHPVVGSARIYFPAGSAWDVLVDQGTGDIWVSQPAVGGISRIDPTTGAQTRWLVGGRPRELAQDSSGRIYATAGLTSTTSKIVRLDPAAPALAINVREWAVPGGGLEFFSSVFATPDGIHIDSGGDVWFTESRSGEIGRLNPTTDVITEYTKSGLSNPQLIATSGSGAKLQAFFTEGAGNSISLVTEIEAVGTDTAVTPVDSVVTPMTHGTSPRDRALSFRNVIIPPVVHDVPGVDGGPDALGTTVTAGPDGIPGNADDERIPGLLRFPLGPTGNSFPSGMTGVALPNTIFGAFLGSDRVFEASSLAIIAPVPRNEVEFNWDLKFCSNPNAFNCKRKTGVVPLTIFGTDELDVSQIDISSLRLARADSSDETGAPVSTKPPADRGSPGDVDVADDGCFRDDVSGLDLANPDGFLDLDVGFSSGEVATVIDCPLGKKVDSAALIVTGTLIDGTPLEALNEQVLRSNK